MMASTNETGTMAIEVPDLSPRAQDDIESNAYEIDPERTPVSPGKTLELMDFTMKQFRSTGEELKQWSPTEFVKVVHHHVDHTWGTPVGKLRLITSSFISLCLAILNDWFLLSILLELNDDSDQEYHAVEWLMTFMEVLIVYALSFMLVVLLLTVICSSSISSKYMIMSIQCLQAIGNFSALLGLRMLTMSGFKRHVQQMHSLMTNFFCISNQKLRDRFGELSIGGILCIRCILILFSSVFIVVACYPILAPAALLLKPRQVQFIATTHISDWDFDQYLKFFGFANNVISLTASDSVAIKTAERVLYMKSDLSLERGRKSMEDLLAYCVWKKERLFAAFVIMNSWIRDRDLYLALLRRTAPIQDV